MKVKYGGQKKVTRWHTHRFLLRRRYVGLRRRRREVGGSRVFANAATRKRLSNVRTENNRRVR